MGAEFRCGAGPGNAGVTTVPASPATPAATAPAPWPLPPPPDVLGAGSDRPHRGHTVQQAAFDLRKPPGQRLSTIPQAAAAMPRRHGHLVRPNLRRIGRDHLIGQDSRGGRIAAGSADATNATRPAAFFLGAHVYWWVARLTCTAGGAGHRYGAQVPLAAIAAVAAVAAV
ncbi:hypothetical protein, partial [Mycobacterium canetti]|uniref:hypothetical protein n=1 Tax=Mycobacterium canetti TaxID=78331 RepID=UPI0005B5428A